MGVEDRYIPGMYFDKASVRLREWLARCARCLRETERWLNGQAKRTRGRENLTWKGPIQLCGGAHPAMGGPVLESLSWRNSLGRSKGPKARRKGALRIRQGLATSKLGGGYAEAKKGQ